ncbi:hypothetical protein PR202_ga16506 [Eleusine coracana subsp. coracana]|uniref:Syringolide-induced protein 14-1-1 n=1 Tax=Eleusine coracana subsp. coracana TaxID=191504 RepID=A0AAV5CNE7_ELECO|nr:hypothetical protein QOZ80_6AG0527690 [Eleusine coracana subsp. coracana]GJM99411.1 hypothetical protein PR202_ga16506 [Eleusine coracana subsp. coracana]
METTKPKQKKRNGRSMSFSGAGLVSFLRSTVASFSSTFPTSSRGRRSSFNHRNAFSGPIVVSIVPPEARGRGGGRRRQSSSSGYRTPEPSSPKVSCIGQIKRNKSKKVNPACCKNGVCPLPPRPPAAAEAARCKPKRSLVKRVLFRRSRSRSSSTSSRSSNNGTRGGSKGVVATDPAPVAPALGGLGHMKRFTSGRAAFQDFDWEAETRARFDDDDEEEEDEGFVAHSAPLVLGGGVVAAEPKKEVGLWRRRPIAPPTPLQLP